MSLRSVARRVPWPALLPGLVATASLAIGAQAGLARGPSQGKLVFAVDAVLPALFGVAMWALIVRRPAIRGRLTALTLSLFLALVAVELLLRAAFPVEYPDYFERAKAARAKGITFDKRSQVEYALDLRKKGTRAYPIFTPASVLFQAENGLFKSALVVGGRETLPLGGVARTLSLGANESGKMAEFVTDELGFNNPPGLWGTGPIDVLLIGDSFATGWGVAPEHNIAAPIRARWPRTVNLGLTGAGPLLELGGLRELGKVLEPKVVLWLYYEGNDLLDLQRERRTLLWGYLTPDFTQDLWARRADVDRELAAFLDRRINTTSAWWSTPLDVASLRRVRALRKGKSERYVPGKADFGRYARVIAEGKKAVAAWGGQTWLVYLPSWGRFTSPAEVAALNGDREQILAIARGEGLTVVDATEIFTAAGDPLDNFPYRLHGHYNPRGYELIGRALTERVAAAGAITP